MSKYLLLRYVQNKYLVRILESTVEWHGYRYLLCIGPKKPVLVYEPRKYGYTGGYKPVAKEGVLKAFQYASKTMDAHYRRDKDLGRNEDDPSYWGNGVAPPEYIAEVQQYGDAGYFIGLVAEYLSKE